MLLLLFLEQALRNGLSLSLALVRRKTETADFQSDMAKSLRSKVKRAVRAERR